MLSRNSGRVSRLPGADHESDMSGHNGSIKCLQHGWY